MTLYNGTIGQLIQGVSQQHPKDRADGQLGAQVNCMSDVVAGLRRRPGLVNLAELTDIDVDFTLDDTTAIYSYDRGDGLEKYIVLVDFDGNIKVYNAATGAAVVVANSEASYVATTNPLQDLRFHTIGDTTFLLNTTKEVAMSTSTNPAKLYEALIVMKKANYGRTYDITIDNGIRATYTTPATVTVSSTQADKTLSLQTETVLQALYVQLVSWGGASVVTRAGDTIYIEMAANFDIATTDGNHGADLYAVRDSVTAWEDLPRIASHGYRVEITGNDDTDINNFWVQFESDNIGTGYFGSPIACTPQYPYRYPDGGSSILGKLTPPPPADPYWYASEQGYLATVGVLGFTTNSYPFVVGKDYQISFSIETTAASHGSNFTIGANYRAHPRDLTLDTSGTATALISAGVNTHTVTITPSVSGDNGLSIQMPALDTSGSSPDTMTITAVSIAEGVNNLWDGPGKWREVAAPGVSIGLDSTTMPMALRRGAAGDFTVLQHSWENRVAGDDTTNPEPSFVGSTISAVGSYQDRLVTLTGENVVMSVTGDRLNFFANSVAAAEDSDPVDSASSSNNITNLKHMVIFDKSLVVFSNNAQFIHPGELAVKSGDFAVQADSDFNMSTATPPIATGQSIVFPDVLGNYVKMWEYRVTSLTGKPQIDQVGKHIPKYIEGTPRQLIGNTSADYTFMMTDASDTTIYVLQYYYHKGERRQLAWHKWSIDSGSAIKLLTQIRNKVYAVITRNGSTYLEHLDLAAPVTEHSDFEIHLDHMDSEQTTAGPYTIGLRTWASRFTDTSSEHDTFVQGEGGDNPGFEVGQQAADGGYIYCDLPADTWIIKGNQFDSSGTVTMPYVKDSAGKAMTKFDLILSDMEFVVSDTGAIKFEVARKIGESYTEVFNGLVLNDYRTKLGEVTLFDTSIVVPINDLREMVDINFSTDTYLPFAIQSADWIGNFSGRGRRSA